MENVSVDDGPAFRAVALELQKQFCPTLGVARRPNTKPPQSKKAEPKPASNAPAVVNPPLDFELKWLDQEHPYLRSRGFSPETIAHFGLGFCARGLLKDRVAIPLQDPKGRLIGYAGRVVDDTLITPDNPRYRFPSIRERDGKIFEFRKSRFLYNGSLVKAPVADLIVVEGFTSVWWLHQNGLEHVVATMGADCSERQAELVVSLVEPSGRVWIVPDGDSAGERHAQSLLALVSPHRFVRWIKLEKDKQPTDYPPQFYHAHLGK